jgi:hypothetical protein
MHLILGGQPYRYSESILGGAAVYRCDHWFILIGGFSR